jgi:glycosyltransferase involved in cell wall biosynthesis
MPRFSLILCTVGRRDEIALFLDSLLRQPGAGDCEVLLVDQNRDDRLAEIVARYGDRLSIRHLPTDTHGLSRARNVGLRHATGELVGFPDDDCEYLDGYLARVEQVFRERPEVDAITGYPTPDRAASIGGSWGSDTMLLDRVGVLNRCQEFTIFVRRPSLGTVRFNDLLGVGAGTPWGSDEGPDFLVRLVDAGRRVVYYPHLLVYHPNKIARITRRTLSRATSYARGRGAFFRLHRYPLPVVARGLFRPAVGCGLYLLLLQPMRSAYDVAIATGTARGLCLTRGEVAQLTGAAAEPAVPPLPVDRGVHANA